jgi:hypothetical protein
LLVLEQTTMYWPPYGLKMTNTIAILAVEQESDGVVVTFSDGTTAGYVVEELLELRPHREPTLPEDACALSQLHEGFGAVGLDHARWN